MFMNKAPIVLFFSFCGSPELIKKCYVAFFCLFVFFLIVHYIGTGYIFSPSVILHNSDVD